jgi:hypothetical protein
MYEQSPFLYHLRHMPALCQPRMTAVGKKRRQAPFRKSLANRCRRPTYWTCLFLPVPAIYNGVTDNPGE